MLVGNKAILKKQDGATHTTLEQVNFIIQSQKLTVKLKKLPTMALNKYLIQ